MFIILLANYVGIFILNLEQFCLYFYFNKCLPHCRQYEVIAYIYNENKLLRIPLNMN